MDQVRSLKYGILTLALIFLSSCATRTKCDCSGGGPVEDASLSGGVPPAPGYEAGSEKDIKARATSVTPTDVAMLNRMLKAVDDYVFREKVEDFKNLCQDPRFDCFVNEKKFPEGKKKVRRKGAAFVSGSKTGLQKNERLNVRYSFYP